MSYEPNFIGAVISAANSSTTNLASGNSYTFTGTADRTPHPDIMVNLYTDQVTAISIQFSQDGTNWDSSINKVGAAGFNEFTTSVKGYRYVRVVVTTASLTTTVFRLQTQFGLFRQGNAPLNATVSNDADSLTTRSVLMGQNDNGAWKFVPVSPEGHLEIAIHDPLLPFGSIHTESLTPVFQTDGVYGINDGQVSTVATESGAVTGSDSMLVCSTGTTIASQAVLLGRKRLRYRAGQGVVARFTAMFTAPVANSYQLVGVGHAEDGVYVGYGDTNDLSNTEFGVLYVNRGVREVKTLTVTTGATSSSDVTITLNGTDYTIAVTNASNIQRTVWEISQGVYAGWDAYPDGDTVVFVRKSAGTTAGTQSFGAGTTGAAATITQTTAGVASTDLFISQSEWNGDKLDGTGPSGITIDPTKLNIFQIGIGYLGTDSIVFKSKVTPANSNNSTWVVFHTIKLSNSLIKSSFGNPSFPFTMAAYSAGSTTDLTVKTSSFAGFIEGGKFLQGNRFSYINAITTVTSSALQCLLTVMNKRVYGGRSNQAVINILGIVGAVKHTQPVVFYLIKNGTLAGNPNFIDISSQSCSQYDTAATTVTYANGEQLIWTGHLGETGDIDHHFGNGSFNAEEVTLQPGEWITLAAKSVQNNVAHATGAINTREDQ